jgi:hypothetical protein
MNRDPEPQGPAPWKPAKLCKGGRRPIFASAGGPELGIRSHWLLGTGLLLSLWLVILLLSGLAIPEAGLTAPEARRSPGLGSEGATGFTVPVSPTAYLPFVSRSVPIVPNVWKAEYYANQNLSGDAQHSGEEIRVDYDWGNGSPSGLLPDQFSARWSGYWDFEVGVYTFFAFADDGVRLWLDDQLLIDSWATGRGSHQATVTVTEAGLHRLKLEYFEATGEAAIRLHWRRTDLYPWWQGDYYREPWVEAGKQYSQNDNTIQFDWGMDCPSGLPCDSFSVSWSATRLFEPGTHRIFLYADEGYQLFVDNNWVGDGGWYTADGGAEDAVYSLEASGVEYHQITYNFHDRGTLAEARLWVEHVEHPRWKAEYYTNTSLNGSPELVKYEDWVFYDWGLEKPRPRMPSANNFSIRWSGQRYFHAGCYRFGLFADDGVRLWIDGELLVDEWQPDRDEYHSPVTYLGTGYHDVVVEYFEATGEAEIRFWWE